MIDVSEETYMVLFTETEFYELIDKCDWFREKLEISKDEL